MSQVMDEGIPGAQQVVDLLEAYADARLSPRGPVLARMRRQVMAEAAARAAAEEAQLQAAIEVVAPRRSWAALHIPRRLAAVGMAAAMTFATSAAVLAAPPGSALYNARITLEQVFLPAEADDRVAAHERLLAERLQEAQAAADAGNTVALQAALAAYQSEIDAAVADVGYDPQLLAFLEGALVKHTALLEALAGDVPTQAAGAIERAIEASQKAARKLHDKEAQPGHSLPPWAGQPGEHATPPPANGGDNQGGENGGGNQNQQR
jgi:hypothetical protein